MLSHTILDLLHPLLPSQPALATVHAMQVADVCMYEDADYPNDLEPGPAVLPGAAQQSMAARDDQPQDAAVPAV